MPYLTPENVPEGTICRPLFIPASSEWLAIVSGALTELTKSYNWQQAGITVEEALEVVQIIINAYYEGGCMDCTEVLECVFPDGELRRYSPTGELEISTDGGETWTEARNRDPRFVGDRVTLTSGIDCDDAKAIVGYIENLIDDIKAQLDLSAAIGTLVSVLLGVLATIFSGGAAAPLAVAFATAVAGLTSAAITSALTEEVMQRLLCNLHEVLNGVETVTAGHYDAIRAQLAIDETGIAHEVLDNAIVSMGAVGLQNAIPLGYTSSVEAYDCADCNPLTCIEWNFDGSAEGWTVVTGTVDPTEIHGVFVDANSKNDANIKLTFSDIAVTRVEFNYNTTCTPCAGANRQARIILRLNGTIVSNTEEAPTGIGGLYGVNYSGTIDEIDIDLNVGTSTATCGIQAARVFGADLDALQAEKPGDVC